MILRSRGEPQESPEDREPVDPLETLTIIPQHVLLISENSKLLLQWVVGGGLLNVYVQEAKKRGRRSGQTVLLKITSIKIMLPLDDIDSLLLDKRRSFR